MAEVAVMALGVLQLITPLLIEKLNLQIMNVDEEIKSMQSWLTLMQSFMEDNYGHQHSKTLADVLRKVCETTFAIEDLVDESNRLSLLHKFHNKIILRDIYQHGLKEKIRRIKEGIKTIMEQKAFTTNSSSSSSTSMPVTPLLPKDEMVGYEDLKRKFITSLVHGEKRPVFLAVDGPPGSGKTTFVANVLNEEKIKKKFHARAFVSARFDDGKSLLQKVCESMKVHDEDELRGFLNGKRYLIFVDDVLGHDELKSLKDSIFSGSDSSSRRRSRIIVTTRSSNVSAICDHAISLQGLGTSAAEKLFFRRAFPGKNEECPPELRGVSTNIAARCGGNPLAIVTVAGALKKQKNLYEWKRFHDNHGSEIWNNSDLGAINNSFLHSYMDLSSRLKCCFLYMSVFPEDRPVERGRLIRLWVAEGFAEATDSHTAEEVAEDYLNQLIQRNLILVSNSDLLSLSNLILNFVIRKSKEENFASVFSQTDTMEDQRRRRRLSFHDHCQLLSPEKGDYDTVRSMFLFRSKEETEPSDSDLNEKLRMLKLIKVLDVQGAKSLTKFPDKITRRVLLRYLSFRDTKIDSIPTSILKLSHLETLDLRRTQVAELPGEISDLHNLRHLLASKYDVASNSVDGVELPAGISRLTNLQTLSLVKVDPSGGVLKELKALTQLKKLGLTHLRREHGKDLCAALESMKTLRTLDITSASKEELIELQKMENQPKSLQRLYLDGRLEKIPAWISELDGVVRIDLKGSGLMNSSLEALKGLRNLRELRLLGCFCGEDLELRFEGEGFEKLEVIVMEDLGNLTRLKVGGGAAPLLKKISVRRCPRLKMPFRVGNLVEFKTAEDIYGGDNYVNKWVNRARSFVPDRINASIDMKLRGINRRH